MTTGRRLVVASLVGLALVVGVIAVGTAALGSQTHADGSGPLGSLGSPGYESMSVDPASGATSWTFGIRLCLAQGTAPAVLTTVSPLATLGSGFRNLGSKIRTFRPTTTETSIISVGGYPPPTDTVPGPLGEVAGYSVTTPCTNGPADPYTELLVGLAREGSDGGGWKGIRVEYSVEGRTPVLELDHELLICGDSNPVCQPSSSRATDGRTRPALTPPLGHG
jgi:hypothetical protein